jgi:hypothetical protein
MRRPARRSLAVFAAGLVALVPALAATLEVDVELVLAVDVSTSMDTEEHRVQREGYLAALADPWFLRAVDAGSWARVAITYVEWAGPDQQTVVLPWTVLAGEADARVIAQRLRDVPPQARSGGTSISGALAFAAGHFEASPYRGRRRVIDLSGDGFNNIGNPLPAVRDSLVTQGITINGLAILLGDAARPQARLPALDAYFEHCVIGGPGAFTIVVASLAEMAEAIRQKLILDVAGRPARHDGRLVPISAETPIDCEVGEQQSRGAFGKP